MIATDDAAAGESSSRRSSTSVPEETALVSLIEDDEALHSVLRRTLQNAGYRVASFDSAEAFLDSNAPVESDCVLLDMSLVRNDGHRMHQRLTERDVRATVLLMSGDADVNNVVWALKSGAADFLVKPFRQEAMLESVRAGVEKAMAKQARRSERERLRSLVARLTPREIEVLELLVAGSDTKSISRQLAISPRTTEVHRQHLMHKMKVTSVVHLVLLCIDFRTLTAVAPPDPEDV